MFATSTELDDGALAGLRAFTAAFERRLADAPPTESVPPAASCAAAYQGRRAMPAPVFLPQARDVEIAGPRTFGFAGLDFFASRKSTSSVQGGCQHGRCPQGSARVTARSFGRA
jgi:hypothetical protein